MQPFKLVFYDISGNDIIGLSRTSHRELDAFEYLKELTPWGHKKHWRDLQVGSMSIMTYLAMGGTDLSFREWLGPDDILAMIRLSDYADKIRFIVDVTDVKVLEFYDAYLARRHGLGIQDTYDADREMSELLGLTLEEHRIPGFYT